MPKNITMGYAKKVIKQKGAADMSALTHLAKLGFSMEEAKTFLLSNVSRPAEIFSVCKQHAVTTSMISEIVGMKDSDVIGFFLANGIDPSPLYPSPTQAPKPSDQIQAITNDVTSSDLWSDLGERVDLINIGIIKDQQIKIAGVLDGISLF